jgi:hypothetical protein
MEQQFFLNIKESTMQLPLPDPDTLFEDLLQDLPPETIDMAYEFKAFTRSRKIKTPQDLLRVVLLYCGLDQSQRQIAGNLALLGIRITDSAINERLAACRPWVKALLPKMLRGTELAPEAHGWRFVIIDGSTVQSPGAKGTEYRLHIGLDLVTLELSHLLISDVKTGESLRHFALGPREIGLADRGYCHPRAVAETVHAGAHLVLRLNPHNMPLYEPDGTAVDLVAVLKGQAPRRVLCTVPVWVGPAEQRVAGWVHAYRLPPEQANLARAACRKRNRKKGKTPQAATLYLAGWVLVWTSMSPDVLSADTVMTLYRARWQVELAIKRWKSLLDADALRARYQSPLAELWLHGKLLYALLVERRMRRTMGDSWGRLDRERTATWWRPWKLMQEALAPRITGALSWDESRWGQSLEVMAERPRRRRLQRLPEAVCQLLYRPDPVVEQPKDGLWKERKAA